MLVSTDTTATLAELVLEYDQRSGTPESSFCQDYQALSLRKYRKSGFIAQQVLLLLAQISHNLMIWMKTWFTEAVAASCETSEKHASQGHTVRQMLQARGLKRLRRDVFAIPGKVCFEGKTGRWHTTQPFISYDNARLYCLQGTFPTIRNVGAIGQNIGTLMSNSP